jgi:uncharacterized membrane protein
MHSGLLAMEHLDGRRLAEVMTTSPYLIATTTAAVSTAVVGGIYYAFSTLVMKGLDRAEPGEAISAMRGMNAEAPANAPFLTLFVGSALLALGVGVIAVFRLSQPGTGYVLAGAVLAVVAFVVTVAFNIPLNDKLAALDPVGLSATDALREWQSYLGPWTAWNHVRAVTAVLGAVLMLVGLRRS